MKNKKLQAIILTGLAVGSIFGVSRGVFAGTPVEFTDGKAHTVASVSGDFSNTSDAIYAANAGTNITVTGPVNVVSPTFGGGQNLIIDIRNGATVNLQSNNNIISATATNNSDDIYGVYMQNNGTLNFNGGNITLDGTLGSGYVRGIGASYGNTININGKTSINLVSNRTDESEGIFIYNASTNQAENCNINADTTINMTDKTGLFMGLGTTGKGDTSGRLNINIKNGATVNVTLTAGEKNMVMGVGLGSGGGAINQDKGTTAIYHVTGNSNNVYGIYASAGGSKYNGYGKNYITVDGPKGVGVYVSTNSSATFTDDLTVKTNNIALRATGSGSSSITVNKNGGSTVKLDGNLVNTSKAENTIDVTLDNANSYLTGLSTVSSASNTTLNLSNSALWNVTGTSSLTNLANNSTVNMRYTGNSTNETITAANVSGNGIYVMNTDLEASYDSKDVQKSGDKIIITNSSSGNNILELRDVSLDKKLQSQGYLLLVEDQSNGGATFSGKDLAHGGIFKYAPVITTANPTDYTGFNASAKNWYLTGFEKLIEVSDNTKATLGLGETRYAGYLMDNDTLLKRLGELRTIKGEPEENGIWARYRHGSMSGDSFSGGFTMVQVGYDKKTSNKRYTGLAFNHTSSSYDFAAGDGEGSQDALTVYNTWLGDKNHYFDIVGKIGKMRGNSTYVDSLYPEKGNYDNWFASISGEYGRKNINDKNGWYYEPQVQLTLGRIRGADYTTSLGTKVELGSITSLIGRAGVTVGKEYNMKDANKHSNIYAKLNWLHEFKGDANIGLRDSYGDTYDTTKEYGGSWWNAGIGATINVNKNTHMYLDFEKNFGGEVTTNWIGQLGCQWTWK